MPTIALTTPESMSLWSLFWQANIVAKIIMVGLLLASVWSWAIIIDKILAYKRARKALKTFEKMFWSSQSLEQLHHQLHKKHLLGSEAIFTAAMNEWKKSFEKGACVPISLQNRIDKAMDAAISREVERLETRLGFLATIGSAAPFIGLFGTVVGIMTSFQSIAASKNTSLAVVAPGIAEALLATAIGLLAAIPAVIAYNKLTTDASKISSTMEGFADEFSAILSRQIDEKLSPR